MNSNLQNAKISFEEYIKEREKNVPARTGTITSAKEYLNWYANTITSATAKANEIAENVKLEEDDAEFFKQDIIQQIRDFQVKYK